MKPLPLPEAVATKLRQAAQLCAESALQSDLIRVGPMGPDDKLTHFGTKTKFGNCIVEITVKLCVGKMSAHDYSAEREHSDAETVPTMTTGFWGKGEY